MKYFVVVMVVAITSGCGFVEFENNLQTQRRKVYDRGQALDGKETEFYSQYDGNLWEDNNVEPIPTARRRYNK